jgi:hypothetical protein
MAERQPRVSPYLAQPQRLAALALYTMAMLVVSRAVTGEWLQGDSAGRLWLLSGAALWSFGLMPTPRFTPPRAALATSLSAALLLGTPDLQAVGMPGPPLSIRRWFAVGLAAVTALAAAISISVRGADQAVSAGLAALSGVAHRGTEAPGRGDVILTPPARIGILGWYQPQPVRQLWPPFPWVLMVTVNPAGSSRGGGSCRGGGGGHGRVRCVGSDEDPARARPVGGHCTQCLELNPDV